MFMVRVVCFMANWLAENPVTAGPLHRYGHLLMPFVLIGIGLTILIESGATEALMPGLGTGLGTGAWHSEQSS